jgi:hypothetical protein
MGVRIPPLEPKKDKEMRIFHCKLLKDGELIAVDCIETSTMVYLYETNPKEYGLIEPIQYARVIHKVFSTLKCYR